MNLEFQLKMTFLYMFFYLQYSSKVYSSNDIINFVKGEILIRDLKRRKFLTSRKIFFPEQRQRKIV